MSNNKETFQRGDFQFEKGTGNVIFVPNENGAWNVQVMPEKPAPEGKGEGWEIVSMKKNGTYIHEVCPRSTFDSWKTFIAQGYEITSVRRLSDNQVFRVGDFIKVIETCRKGWSDPITGFLITGNSMVAQFERWRQPINHLERMHKEIKVTEAPVPKQPLFTTSDGKDVYEGDRYYWVDTDIWTNGWSIASTPITNPNYFNNHKMFYTPDESNEYILLNKPCLSVQDVMNRLNAYFEKHSVIPAFENIKLFAKSKIDKP